MWTEAQRARHEPRLKELVSGRSADEIAGWLGRADPPRSGRATPTRRVVGAIAWHLRVGGPWRVLPQGFPPWRTVYGWFRRWLDLGLFDVLLRDVARRRRRKVGRRRGPSLGIVDTQTVKCIAVRGPRGTTQPRARSGASGWRWSTPRATGSRSPSCRLPCRTGTRWRRWTPARSAGRRLREGVYDAAFAAERCRTWSNLHGMRHRVVTRDPAASGFVVLARRWVVERSFGWLSHWGGLARDRAGRLDVAAARLTCACVLSGFEALLNPMPIRTQ